MKAIRIKPLLLIILALGLNSKSEGQDRSKALAAADSSNFSPDKQEGWQLYNSYISSYTTDSVTLELIIQHANTGYWNAEQFMGRIKAHNYLPLKEQKLIYQLVDNSYLIRITTKGKCYISLANGMVPPKGPVVLPIKIKYTTRK